MTTTENEKLVLADALECLRQYYKYGEEMRKIGRGFQPTGLQGHTIESVIHSFTALAESHLIYTREV